MHAYTQNMKTHQVKQICVSIKRQSFSGSAGGALLRNTAPLQAGLAIPSSARLHPAALCEHEETKSLVRYTHLNSAILQRIPAIKSLLCQPQLHHCLPNSRPCRPGGRVCNPSNWEAAAGRTVSSKPAWRISWDHVSKNKTRIQTTES